MAESNDQLFVIYFKQWQDDEYYDYDDDEPLFTIIPAKDEDTAESIFRTKYNEHDYFISYIETIEPDKVADKIDKDFFLYQNFSESTGEQAEFNKILEELSGKLDNDTIYIDKSEFGGELNKMYDPMLDDYDSRYTYCGVLINNVQVGNIVLQERANDVLYIDDIFLYERFRNKGYGTKIIKFLIQELNPKAILLDSVPDAVEFYKKLGFRQISKEENQHGCFRMRLNVKNEDTQIMKEFTEGLENKDGVLVMELDKGKTYLYHRSPEKFKEFDFSKCRSGQGATRDIDGMWFFLDDKFFFSKGFDYLGKWKYRVQVDISKFPNFNKRRLFNANNIVAFCEKYIPDWVENGKIIDVQKGYVKEKLQTQSGNLRLINIAGEKNNKKPREIVVDMGYDGLILQGNEVVVCNPDAIHNVEIVNETLGEQVNSQTVLVYDASRYTNDIKFIPGVIVKIKGNEQQVEEVCNMILDGKKDQLPKYAKILLDLESYYEDTEYEQHIINQQSGKSVEILSVKYDKDNEPVSDYIIGNYKVDKIFTRSKTMSESKLGRFSGKPLTESVEPQSKVDWTKVFESFLDITEFSVHKSTDEDGNPCYVLRDQQGGNLGDIESDTFQNAEQIIDRMGVYIDDYFIEPIIDNLAQYDIDCPESADEIIKLIRSEQFKNDCPELYKEYNEPNSDVQILELVAEHGGDVDLERVATELDDDNELGTGAFELTCFNEKGEQVNYHEPIALKCHKEVAQKLLDVMNKYPGRVGYHWEIERMAYVPSNEYQVIDGDVAVDDWRIDLLYKNAPEDELKKLGLLGESKSKTFTFEQIRKLLKNKYDKCFMNGSDRNGFSVGGSDKEQLIKLAKELGLEEKDVKTSGENNWQLDLSVFRKGLLKEETTKGNKVPRDATKLKLTAKQESSAHKPGDTTVIVKDEFGRWTDGKYQYLIAHIRNSDYYDVEVLEKRKVNESVEQDEEYYVVFVDNDSHTTKVFEIGEETKAIEYFNEVKKRIPSVEFRFVKNGEVSSFKLGDEFKGKTITDVRPYPYYPNGDYSKVVVKFQLGLDGSEKNGDYFDTTHNGFGDLDDILDKANVSESLEVLSRDNIDTIRPGDVLVSKSDAWVVSQISKEGFAERPSYSITIRNVEDGRPVYSQRGSSLYGLKIERAKDTQREINPKYITGKGLIDNTYKRERKVVENQEDAEKKLKPTIYNILGWLKNHNQAYKDFKTYFKLFDGRISKMPSIEDIKGWISDHKVLTQDYENFFDDKIDESLKEDFSQEDIEKKLEQPKQVYSAYKIKDNTYRLETDWVKTIRQAHSVYLKVKEQLKSIFGVGNISVTYVRNEYRDNDAELHCVLEVTLMNDAKECYNPQYEKVEEDYKLSTGTRVKVFSDYDKAKEYAEANGYKESEYGDFDNEYSYCYWNKSGDRNQDEEVACFYKFVDGKPVALDDKDIEILNKREELGIGVDIDQEDYIYLFPELNQSDLNALWRYQLKFLGKNYFDGQVNYAVKGTEKDLNDYAHNYLDYELHPDYLYKENDFAGDIVSGNDKWFGILNHSEMTDINVLLIGKDKDEVLSHWDDLIEITESQPDETEDSEQHYTNKVEPLIKQLKEKGILTVNDEYDNLFRLDDNHFDYEGQEVEIVKQKSTRF